MMLASNWTVLYNPWSLWELSDVDTVRWRARFTALSKLYLACLLAHVRPIKAPQKQHPDQPWPVS